MSTPCHLHNNAFSVWRRRSAIAAAQQCPAAGRERERERERVREREIEKGRNIQTNKDTGTQKDSGRGREGCYG